MTKLTFCLFLLMMTMMCVSCYRMPTDEDYSMIPLTNNRDFTREKAQGLPGISY